MPVQTKLDPIGVKLKPNVISEPARIEAKTAEIQQKFGRIKDNYWVFRKLLGDPDDLNRSLIKLRSKLSKKQPMVALDDLHLELLTAVRARARSIANNGDIAGAKQPGSKDLHEAAVHIASTVNLPKKPRDDILRFHVEAVMAGVIEATGRRVTASRTRNSTYDPHLSEGVSEAVGRVFADIDPSVTATSLTNIVIDARKRYAGRLMRFDDYFPFRGSTGDPLVPVTCDGFELHSAEWIDAA